MKTKIIYISGNEVFDMRDIRAAFEEVRSALNLDKDTVMFGVPVDADDACIMNTETPKEIAPVIEEAPEPIEETIPETPVIEEAPVIEATEQIAPKKRGRPRKEPIVETVDEENSVEQVIEPVVSEEQAKEPVEEKTVSILSVLSGNTTEPATESDDATQIESEVEIISEITDEKAEDIVPEEPIEEDEPDLEKLLSEMTPLAEDTVDEPVEEVAEETPETDLSVDATLEQLATEFVSSQDKIASETKPQSRSKIGKLRNILPFKQSKHKDQGMGDLLEWAGIAANDEDFSVPGFFTSAASRK